MVKAVKVVGVRKYSFKTIKGDEVKMVVLSCLFKDDKTEGAGCIIFNVTERFYDNNNIKVNSSYEFAYTVENKRNRLVAVFPIE